MGDSHQNAKIELDWSKAQEYKAAYTVEIGLWNSIANQASMGNVAVANNTKALVIGDTIYFATNPVDVSGYQSALTDIKYDAENNSKFTDIEVVKTATINSGTKHDGTDHEITYVYQIGLLKLLNGHLETKL